MRVLALVTAGFAAATLTGVYLPLQPFQFLLGGGFGVLWLLLVLPVGPTSRWRRRLACGVLGLALGFGWTGLYRQQVFGPAEALNDQTVRMTATVLEWPEEGKFGSCTMAVRAEINGSSIKAVLTLDE